MKEYKNRWNKPLVHPPITEGEFRKRNIPDFNQSLIDYEQGTLSEEKTIRLFQYLVSTGLAWSLQGRYGRTARIFIDAGLVHE